MHKVYSLIAEALVERTHVVQSVTPSEQPVEGTVAINLIVDR